MHGWTRPDPAGSGLAGGGPGDISGGKTGQKLRVPEAREPTGPGGDTMMPGETHSAAPGSAADLSRCQGCASLQQVRHLSRAEGGGGLGGCGVLPHGLRVNPSRCPPSRSSFSCVALGSVAFAYLGLEPRISFPGCDVAEGGGSEFGRTLPHPDPAPGLVLRFVSDG